MRVGVLAWDDEEIESHELVEVARAIGHDSEMFVLDDVRLRIRPGSIAVEASGLPVSRFDVLISRAQMRHSSWQRDGEILSLLGEIPGTLLIDPYQVHVPAEGKFLSTLRLGRANLPVLETVMVTTLEEVEAALDRWGRIVLKPSDGYGGYNVTRLGFDHEDWRAPARRLLQEFGGLVCQPYLDMPQGDVRVATVGSAVVHAFARAPAPGGWKANIFQGGVATVVEPEPELCDLAITAAQVSGLSVAGADIVRTPRGLALLEVNPIPGWFPLPRELRISTARHVVDHVVRMRARGADHLRPKVAPTGRELGR